MTLLLTLREAPGARVDAAALRPDALAGLTVEAIRRLAITVGRRPAVVGDLFAVSGDGGPDMRVEGDLRRVDRLGEGMADGRLELDGPAGDHVGARMSGGTIVARGDVGAYAGAELRGGLLHVRGDAGEGLAAAYPGTRAGMRGGEVLVEGSAGDEAGAGMRRGLVAVGGAVGAGAGLRMLAGTLIALGGFGPEAGICLRRGSLVSAGAVEIPSTYAFACRYRPPALRLQLLRLAELGLGVDERLLHATWSRWSGDRLELARGEILVLENDERRR